MNPLEKNDKFIKAIMGTLYPNLYNRKDCQSMCGIAGILKYNGQPPHEETLKQMTGVMNHRGPNHEEYGSILALDLVFADCL